jgi:RecJ-like exonuclease
MKVEIECPRCNGLGEVLGSTPNVRARYVGRDDLDPADFGEDCPKCAGTGTVDYDPDDEVEDWMRS